MSFLEKRYGFSVDGNWLEVLGETGAIHPKWSLYINEELVDSQKKTGKFELVGNVDGKTITAEIEQGGFGAVTVVVKKDGKKIELFEGFLA